MGPFFFIWNRNFENATRSFEMLSIVRKFPWIFFFIVFARVLSYLFVFQILSFQLLPSFFLSFFSNSFSSISHRGKTKPSVIVKNEPLYSESWEWGYTCNIKNVWCILTINSFWDRSVHLKIFGKSYFQKATPRFTIFSYRWSLPPSLHSFIRLFIMYLFIW